MKNKSTILFTSLLAAGLLNACSTTSRNADRDTKPVPYATINGGGKVFVDRYLAQKSLQVVENAGEMLVKAVRGLSRTEQATVSAELAAVRGAKGASIEAMIKDLSPVEQEKFQLDLGRKYAWFAGNKKVNAALQQASKEREALGNINTNAGPTSGVPEARVSANNIKLVRMTQRLTRRLPGQSDAQYTLAKSVTNKAVTVFENVGEMTANENTCVGLSEGALKNSDLFKTDTVANSQEALAKYPSENQMAKRQEYFECLESQTFFKNIADRLGVNGAKETFAEARALIRKCHQNAEELIKVLDQWENNGVDPRSVSCK